MTDEIPRRKAAVRQLRSQFDSEATVRLLVVMVHLSPSSCMYPSISKVTGTQDVFDADILCS